MLSLTQREELIRRIAPLAQISEAESGVPASITIAQGILESGWGESLLAKRANNWFGIKVVQSGSEARNGDAYVEFQTAEVLGGKRVQITGRFEKFRDLESCFRAHGRLLAGAARYAPAIADADDPLVFAQRLYECGYSTDPDYPKKLATLINQFKLIRFDAQRGAPRAPRQERA